MVAYLPVSTRPRAATASACSARPRTRYGQGCGDGFLLHEFFAFRSVSLTSFEANRHRGQTKIAVYRSGCGPRRTRSRSRIECRLCVTSHACCVSGQPVQGCAPATIAESTEQTHSENRSIPPFPAVPSACPRSDCNSFARYGAHTPVFAACCCGDRRTIGGHRMHRDSSPHAIGSGRIGKQPRDINAQFRGRSSEQPHAVATH
jgi:hypothetical protein